MSKLIRLFFYACHFGYFFTRKPSKKMINYNNVDKYKGQEVPIILNDDTFYFEQPYRLNDMEITLVKAWMEELLEVGLVEFSKREYALATIMFTKKTFSTIGLNVRCVETIDVSKREHNLTNMQYHC